MNPVKENSAHPHSPPMRVVFNEDEAIEAAQLLNEFEGTHESSETIEDSPPKPHPSNEPDPRHSRRHNALKLQYDGPNHANNSPQNLRHTTLAHFWNKWSKARIRRWSISAILGFLLILSLVFFIMIFNPRKTPSSLETIERLTHRVSKLSNSLSTCSANTTQLAIKLYDKQHRFEVCHENERKLEERIDVVHGMFERCQTTEEILKECLKATQSELSVCNTERDELKRQMERAIYIHFMKMVGKLGTGGDSWVCSDKTKLWSYGFTTTESPHSTVKIQTWTSELLDAEHSAKPLVFPPAFISDSTLSKASPSFQSRIQKRKTYSSFLGSAQIQQKPSPRIIGYTVLSENTVGNNGWWRVDKLSSFGAEQGKIEFFAQAALWYRSKARFRVTVFWV